MAAGNRPGNANSGQRWPLWLPALLLTPEAQSRGNGRKTRWRHQRQVSLDSASCQGWVRGGEIELQAASRIPEVYQWSRQPLKQMLWPMGHPGSVTQRPIGINLLFCSSLPAPRARYKRDGPFSWSNCPVMD